MADSRCWFWKASAGGVSFAFDGRVLVDSAENRECAEDGCLITQRMFDFEGSDMEVQQSEPREHHFTKMMKESLFPASLCFDISQSWRLTLRTMLQMSQITNKGRCDMNRMPDPFEEKRRKKLLPDIQGIKNRAKIVADSGDYHEAEDMLQENIELLYDAINDLLNAQRVVMAARMGMVLPDGPEG